MCTKATLDEVLKRFRKEAERVFGNKLEAMILYGSYARGDNTDESDIDVMFIVDIPTEDEVKYLMKMAEVSSDLDIEFDVVLSPLVESKEKYVRFKNVNPLFRNIEEEGIRIAA